MVISAPRPCVGVLDVRHCPVKFERASRAALGVLRGFKMKRPKVNPTEDTCPACNGTGVPTVKQPAQPDRKIYPEPCKKCGGKGRISNAVD
jgi:DnaJ-class molecular chaperone